MSIDFSTLQGLSIPEGVVTQIARDGVVLWSAVKNAIITLPNGTITYFGSGSKERCLSITGDGISGNQSEVPIGTVLTCTISGGDYDNAYIILNGTTVASGSIYDGHPVTYDYKVTGNATITLTQESYGYYIRITEVP